MKKDIKDTKKTKEIKFETKQLKNTSVDHNNSAVVTFIIALIVIAVLVGGLYYVNAKFVTKDKYQDVKYGIKFGDKNIGFNNKFYTLPYFPMFLLKEFIKRIDLNE